MRFTDPSGNDPGMILIDGKYIAGSDGIVYIQNGEIAWDYYVDWFRSDPEGFRTMVGSNDKMTAIAAATPIYSMGGLPIAGSGGYGSAKYIEKAATGPTSKVTITNQAKGTGNLIDSSPIKIPSNATKVEQAKNGYQSNKIYLV